MSETAYLKVNTFDSERLYSRDSGKGSAVFFFGLRKLCNDDHAVKFDAQNPSPAAFATRSAAPRCRIRTWQGSEELARGHRGGWPQGSHWERDGTPSPVQGDATGVVAFSEDTYVSNAVSSSCPTWTSPRGAAMSAAPRRSEHSPATLWLLSTVFMGLVVTTKPPHLITVSLLFMPRLLNQQVKLGWTSENVDHAAWRARAELLRD